MSLITDIIGKVKFLHFGKAVKDPIGLKPEKPVRPVKPEPIPVPKPVNPKEYDK